MFVNNIKLIDEVTILLQKFHMSALAKAKRKIPNTNVFHIRLGPHIQKIDIQDPAFLKVLQQQYATKYLQKLGVQTNLKNIHKILKQYPLKNCEILQSRLSGGLHTDTITIIPKKQSYQFDNNANTNVISNDMLKMLDLKKINTKKIQKIQQKPVLTNAQKKTELTQPQQKGLQYISFDIKTIKERYIFPFNETFKRANNYKMKDVYNLIDAEEQENQQNKAIFEAKIFKFPFTQIELSLKILKQLQTPISTKLIEIENFLKQFKRSFPMKIFPIRQSQTENPAKRGNSVQKAMNLQLYKKQSIKPTMKTNVKKSNHIAFTEKQIQRVFSLLVSEQNAKFIGVFLHLAYWSIFRGVNPIQVDLTMKKKMYILMFETLQYFQLKTQNRKLWQSLGFPLTLLTLKMAAQYFFTENYSKLFLSEQSIKIGANDLAFDKILLLVEKLFDQGNINGRFVFLESDIDGPKGNFIKDNKYIRKRIFGTSPALAMILPEPTDGKARSIIAKSNQIDINKGIIEDSGNYRKIVNDDINQLQCRQKLLHLTLLKINNHIQQITGHENNPIMQLKSQ